MILSNLFEDVSLGYDNLRKLLQAHGDKQDAVLSLGGEPVTLNRQEVLWLVGKYQAYRKDGKVDDFIKVLEDPVRFDRHMKQLRTLHDKQKNVTGSVPGQRNVTVNSLTETPLNPNDPVGDYMAKRKALGDIQQNPQTGNDPALAQRMKDLEQQAAAAGLDTSKHPPVLRNPRPGVPLRRSRTTAANGLGRWTTPAERGLEEGVAEGSAHQLNELFDAQQEYFKLANGQVIRVDYRQAGLNPDAMPGSIEIVPVNPKIMPTSGLQTIQPWDKANNNIKKAIQKWVQSDQQGVAEGFSTDRQNMKTVNEAYINSTKDAVNVLANLRKIAKSVEIGNPYNGNLANEYVNDVWNVYTWLENRTNMYDPKLKNILNDVFALRKQAKQLETGPDSGKNQEFANRIVNTLWPLIEWIEIYVSDNHENQNMKTVIKAVDAGQNATGFNENKKKVAEDKHNKEAKPGTVTDKSGAVHSPMSRARHLAKKAMQNQAEQKPAINTLQDAIHVLARLRDISKGVRDGKTYTGNLAKEYYNDVWNVYTWLEKKGMVHWNKFAEEDLKLRVIISNAFDLRKEAKLLHRSKEHGFRYPDELWFRQAGSGADTVFAAKIVQVLEPWIDWLKTNMKTNQENVAEGRWFRTAYGWAGGSKPGGGTYKQPKADPMAKKLADVGEYDREGDMAISQLKTAEDAASELRSILDADENLPEWIQSKITRAVDYLDTARDYMKSKKQNVTEGTWAWPDTGITALQKLMKEPLMVGDNNAENAREKLTKAGVGDDRLWDILVNMSEENPMANVWDNKEVMDRLKELDTMAKKYGHDELTYMPVNRSRIQGYESAQALRRNKEMVESGLSRNVELSRWWWDKKGHYEDVSDEEFAKQFPNLSNELLIAMAEVHGYGKGSTHYVDKRNRGRGVREDFVNEKKMDKLLDRWMNSEHAPLDDESGDDNALFRKAIHFAADVLDNRSDSETHVLRQDLPKHMIKYQLAWKLVDKFNGMEDEEAEGVREAQDIEEGWKSSLAGAAIAGMAAFGGGAHAGGGSLDSIGINQQMTQQAQQQSPKQDLSGFSTEYLTKAADPNRIGRYMVSQDDAKNELEMRVQGKNQQKVQPSKASGQSGFSKEYLQKAADPNRLGRYLISVEKAQELLKNMQEGMAEGTSQIDPDQAKLQGHDINKSPNLIQGIKWTIEDLLAMGREQDAQRLRMKNSDKANAITEGKPQFTVGDPVIILDNAKFSGKTGNLVDFGKDKNFVIVDLPNFGKHVFHSSHIKRTPATDLVYLTEKESAHIDEGFDDYEEIAKELIKRHGPKVNRDHVNAIADERDSRGSLDHGEVMHHVKELLRAGYDKQYDKTHGSPWDRGSADSYYGRPPRPHKGGVTSGGVSLPEITDLTPDEIEAYHAGYDENEESGNKKVWEANDMRNLLNKLDRMV